jgi:hypothetical protein
MLKELGPSLDRAIESNTYKDTNGNDRKKYDLPKRETLILTSGYSRKSRGKSRTYIVFVVSRENPTGGPSTTCLKRLRP